MALKHFEILGHHPLSKDYDKDVRNRLIGAVIQADSGNIQKSYRGEPYFQVGTAKITECKSRPEWVGLSIGLTQVELDDISDLYESFEVDE